MNAMNKAHDTSLRYLKGIGPKRAKTFANYGVSSVEDLLYYFPKRYEDRRNLVSVSNLKLNEVQTIKVKVLASGQHNSWRRRSFNITEVMVGDDTGRLSCVWFNQPYLRQYFKPGVELILYGKVDLYGSKLQMSNPEFEIISDQEEELNTAGIVPVYPLPEGISQRSLRKLLKAVLSDYLPKINDCLPFDIRQRNSLLNLAKSLLNIHFPESFLLQSEAYTRLSFEDFFLFQLPLVLRKMKRETKEGIAHKVEGDLVKSYQSALPFKLTVSQGEVLDEIKADMAKPLPMQRLLQGDVGSGKTVVANISAMIAIQGGYQVAFMVPTEILAQQHFNKISSQGNNVRMALLTSGADKKEKEKIYKSLKEGKIDLIIGTHALLEEKVKFNKLGLVIIDEQHKFGVGQRALLPSKGASPDVLIMTATPIPRTLAITLYGDLDVSIINELPPGRLPIETRLFDRKHKNEAYELARQELRRGNQAYIIYPVIEESYSLDISGAKKMYNELKLQDFKDFKLGIIHGKLTQDEQDKAMQRFKDKELDLLISTTILEVGIDIPAATCMIIEHAERFGLSQLHQLRGRVGRGSVKSSCLLISDADSDDALSRLNAMVKYYDGFKIAEEDLKIRGPGQFFGRQQHGLSELKIGNPLTQLHLLKRAREEAIRLLGADPHLNDRQNVLLKEKLLQRFPEYEELILVG
jgi:ATP-dependent DNA helicase RecG